MALGLWKIVQKPSTQAILLIVQEQEEGKVKPELEGVQSLD